MSEYYDHTTFPTSGSGRSSAAMRAELAAIEAGFNKLPTLSGNPGKLVVVNAAGNALEARKGLQIAIDFAKGADIASAATLDLDGATGNYLNVTGTTGITAITLTSGAWRLVRFAGILTLTNGVSLDLGGSNVTTAAGDIALIVADGTVIRVQFIGRSGLVFLTGDQTIAGVKTFTSKPVLPATTPAGHEAASAAYVATQVVLASGVKQGLTLSNNGTDATNDIDIAAGKAVDSSSIVNMTLAAAMTKRLDANWAAGTNQGGRYSGAAIANTTYHVWLAAKAAGADVDVYLAPSAVPATVLGWLQAETGGAAYLYVWRIGSILRESAAIVPFTQRKDYFERNTLSAAVSATNPGTSAVTRTLNGIPDGIPVEADIFASMALTIDTAGTGLISALTAADDVPGLNNGIGNFGQPKSAFTTQGVPSEIRVMTNTSAQVRSRISTSDGNTVLRIVTRGWKDYQI